MTLDKLEKMLAEGSLRTRAFGRVRKLVPCYDLKNRRMVEVYVVGTPWCLATVYVDNGLLEDGEENDEDLIY